MIPEPGDPDRDVLVAETFHEQTDKELTEQEVKQMEADDQAIQIILMDLPEDIYAVVDSTDNAKITRKRSKPGKHGHETDKVHKSQEFSIKRSSKSAKVNSWSTYKMPQNL
ncbi:hypothetical protein Tco_1511817 [Tanacetum coccineum]